MTLSPIQFIRLVLAVIFLTLTAVRLGREHREHKSMGKTSEATLGVVVAALALFVPLPGMPNIFGSAGPTLNASVRPSNVATNAPPARAYTQSESPAPEETSSATPFPISLAHTGKLNLVAPRLAEDMDDFCNGSGDSSEASRRYATAFVIVAARLKARPEFKDEILPELDLPVYGDPSCDDFRNGAKVMEDLAARLP